MPKRAKVSKFTYIPHTIEFRMIDLFPIPNLIKSEECPIFWTNLGLK